MRSSQLRKDLKSPTFVHRVIGVFSLGSPFGLAGGIIRYQPTSASAAAWRSLIQRRRLGFDIIALDRGRLRNPLSRRPHILQMQFDRLVD